MEEVGFFRMSFFWNKQDCVACVVLLCQPTAWISTMVLNDGFEDTLGYYCILLINLMSFESLDSCIAGVLFARKAMVVRNGMQQDLLHNGEGIILTIFIPFPYQGRSVFIYHFYGEGRWKHFMGSGQHGFSLWFYFSHGG